MNYQRIVLLTTALALCVVVLGAYVRLSDGGLGCPDWPGCYGHIGVPESADAVATANANFDRPVEAHKAWKEMIHRYFAGALGLLIAFLTIQGLRRKAKVLEDQRGLLVGLSLLVIFQALLGMWTVTLLLKPLVVTAHLLGGLLTLSGLWVLALRTNKLCDDGEAGVGAYKALGTVAMLVLVVQIFLGGWTSTNYAALACTDFPTCHGQWWPETDFGEAVVLWRGLGVDYEYGVLENPARVAIHLTHRIGALVTFLVLQFFLIRLFMSGLSTVRKPAMAIQALLITQLGLGISNIVFSLPLLVAVAHNGVAALLLLSLIAISRQLRSTPPPTAAAV